MATVMGPNDGSFDADLLSKPKRPQYENAYNPLTMSLETDSRAMNKFRDEALRTGPSAWAKLSRSRQGLLQQGARDSAAREVSGRNAQTRSLLAMRGGLDGGARERVARGGGRDLMEANQNIHRQGMINDAQIGINDEANRIQQLSMVPGLQNESMKPSIFNITNQLGENQRKNQFGMDAYKEEMGAWGAHRTADAIERSGK